LLGGTMGAAPSQITSEFPSSPPPFLPLATQKPVQKQPEELPAKPFEVGKASWYGDLFQGKATASGEDFDMFDFTAAHRELPLGTYVKVTNLRNRKSVVVRINDRGPVTPGRIIDLSYSAARGIGMHQKGLVKVRIDIIDPKDAEMAMAKQPAMR
jgi:rare lipoprotein A